MRTGGQDPDFHRRDLWEAIESGQKTGIFPEFELGLQIVEEQDEDAFDFDLLVCQDLGPEDAQTTEAEEGDLEARYGAHFG